MTLAIQGGTPVRTKPFPAHNTIGEEEKKAVERVFETGIFSKFLGAWHEYFYGGTEVRALEEEWADYFNVKHAVAVNSCTSGLNCAVGAVGVEPGDEIIVTPYTMSATAMAPLVYNAVPVFADIEKDCFCLDPEAVEKAITPRTRAIIVVDIFGQPYDVDAINGIAEKHGLYVIEDNAQGPGAMADGKFAGTLGDIGIFSLNYHKHIHSGEGGIITTNDDNLAERLQLIRNHAESVVEGKNVTDLRNLIGFNYRMTELEAAVARCQLKKLAGLNSRRLENCRYLEKKLSQIPAITVPAVRDDCTHVYYQHACRFDEKVAGVHRNIYIEAVKAELKPFELREKEGVIMSCGYVRPLYLLPLFQQQIAYGSKGFPFTLNDADYGKNYEKGSCPVVERMHENELFLHELIVPSMEETDLDDVFNAFEKVWDHRDQLKGGRL